MRSERVSVEEWVGAGVVGLPPSRVGQHVAMGIATERSAATRLKDSLSLSRVGQHVAMGIATERSAATRLRDAPAPRQPARVDCLGPPAVQGGGAGLKRWCNPCPLCPHFISEVALAWHLFGCAVTALTEEMMQPLSNLPASHLFGCAVTALAKAPTTTPGGPRAAQMRH